MDCFRIAETNQIKISCEIMQCQGYFLKLLWEQGWQYWTRAKNIDSCFCIFLTAITKVSFLEEWLCTRLTPGFVSKVFSAEKKKISPLQFGSVCWSLVIIFCILRQCSMNTILRELIACFISLFNKCYLGRNARYQVPLYLWWMETSPKCWIVPNYYVQDCRLQLQRQDTKS